MPQALFVFMQFEFPWALGPADGRYLLRDGAEAEAEYVVVLDTIGARRASELRRQPGGPAGRLLARLAGEAVRRGERAASSEAAPVSTSRVTVVDPVPLSAEHQARAWLEDLDREHDVQRFLAVVNRVLQMHRIASADAYIHEVASGQALVVRAGWGEGEQVAYGQWLHARELSLRPRRGGRRGGGRDRSWALRPQERLAALLGGRSRALLCEELALRSRLDLDQGRLAHAAVGLDRALAAAVRELTVEGRQDLTLRIAELEQLRSGVSAQAEGALANGTEGLDEDLLAHALGRLEASLRARTAPGV